MSDVNIPLELAQYLNSSNSEKLGWLVMYSDNPTPDATPATLYYAAEPPIPDAVMVIQKYEGAAPDETFGNPLQVRKPRIQIKVRDSDDGDLALSRCNDAMEFLCTVKDETINGIRYQRIRPVGEPFEIGPDESDRPQAVVNLEVFYYDSVGSFA